MKNWKKGLACLLAGVMLLAMLTACGSGLNLGVTLKGTGTVNEARCQTLVKDLNADLTYSEDLTKEARKIADFVAGNPVELKEENNALIRVTASNPVINTYLESGELVDALLSYDCILTNDNYGFGISYDYDDGFNNTAYFSVPKEGYVTQDMQNAAKGKKEVGAAYIRTSEGDYIVMIFR